MCMYILPPAPSLSPSPPPTPPCPPPILLAFPHTILIFLPRTCKNMCNLHLYNLSLLHVIASHVCLVQVYVSPSACVHVHTCGAVQILLCKFSNNTVGEYSMCCLVDLQ